MLSTEWCVDSLFHVQWWDTRTDLPLSATIQTYQLREFNRVTLHCEFGVSPLEISGFGAIPPSPPVSKGFAAMKIGANPFWFLGRTPDARRLRGHAFPSKQFAVTLALGW